MNESNKQKGWIKLYRSIRDNSLWNEKPFDKARAWIDILLMANHENRDVGIGNQTIHVNAGSFITSIAKLTDRWGWAKNTVRRYLNRLESETMIEHKAERKWTIVTVLNWASYQDGWNESGTKVEHKWNESGTKTDPNNNKEIRNKKKENDKNPFDHPADDRTRNDPQFDLFWKAYPRKVGKTKAYAAWKRIHPDRELFEKIMAAVETAKSSRQWMENYGQFIPHPTTWLNRGGWDDELPDPNMVDGHRLTDTQMAQYKHYHELGWSTEDILGYLGVITGDDNGEANIY
jgi:hypothetical protein